MVSSRPVISESFGLFINPSVIVPKAPIKVETIVSFMFHSLFFFNFFNSLARFCYLFFNFTLWSAGTVKSTILQNLFFLYYYYYYYCYLLWGFSHQRQLVVFHGSLGESKSPQVSRTLFSILAVLNNVFVSTNPPTSKSSSPFSNSFVTVPKAPITIGIIVTFMFYSFVNSLARSWYLSFSLHYISFILWSAGTAKSLFFCWLL